jgi:non-ribosomal peptide synthetase component F
MAVVFEDQRLSYRETFIRRATQLGHHLQQLAVGPDVVVGLCIERSLELIVGVLGHPQGGWRVPCRSIPEYPSKRIASMLEDARVPVLVTQQHLLPRSVGIIQGPHRLPRSWSGARSRENPPRRR